MFRNIKSKLRDLFPNHVQVPLKYWFSKISGQLEPEMTLLPKLLRPNSRVIDIGANRGIYAYPLSQLFCYVELFEPNPNCVSVLRSWASKKSNVQVHEFALSDCDGVASLQIPVDASGVHHDSSASLDQKPFGKHVQYLIRLTTLDNFDFNNVALIKIDVEGHEHRVISGAIRTISLEKPALLIEIEQRHGTRSIDEVFIQVQNLGYQGFFLHRGSLNPLATFNPNIHQLAVNLGRRDYVNNFLFLHQIRINSGDYDSLI